QIRRNEEDLVAEEVEQGAEAVKMIVAEGTASAMNHFNRRVPPPGEDEAAKKKRGGFTVACVSRPEPMRRTRRRDFSCHWQATYTPNAPAGSWSPLELVEAAS